MLPARLGLRFALALEIEGHRSADEVLQSRLIDLYHVRGLGPVEFLLSFFSLVLAGAGCACSPPQIAPCGRGGVRAHPRERTRTDGTESARRLTPEVVPVSTGRGGAVRPRWPPQNRPRAALTSALTRSAVAYEVDARSLRLTVVTRPGGSISRGGSAPQ